MQHALSCHPKGFNTHTDHQPPTTDSNPDQSIIKDHTTHKPAAYGRYTQPVLLGLQRKNPAVYQSVHVDQATHTTMYHTSLAAIM